MPFGYAAHAADSPLSPFRFERRELRADDVLVDILYCGVCHSDLHTVRNDWGNARYPIVPGHEIVGRVNSVGPEVTRFKAGDTVGVGVIVDSCRRCKACARGWQQYCEKGSTATYNDVDRRDRTPTHGGYADRIVTSESFVFAMPPGLDLAGAAPLLCAGITTWSPLRHWQVGKGSRVAVVGLGGLGHMALKLANALGAEVTLFTRSPGKDDDARRLGAHDVVLSTDAAQLKAAGSRFDLIVDTVPYVHDLNPYVSTLAVNGTLVLVGYLGPLKLNTAPLVLSRRAIAGSIVGGVPETQNLLDFCGKHGITADVEMIRIEDINAAYERVLKSDVKYRFVIDMASLKA